MYKVPNYCHYFFCSKDDNFKGLNEPGASVAGKLKGDWGCGVGGRWGNDLVK